MNSAQDSAVITFIYLWILAMVPNERIPSTLLYPAVLKIELRIQVSLLAYQITTSELFS